MNAQTLSPNVAPSDARTLQPGDLIPEAEAAGILDCTVSTLRNWRWKGTGPRFRKIGRMVRYHRADLQAFIDGKEAA